MLSEVTLRPATIDDALFIARGFHMAMLYDEAPEEHTQTFAREICMREDVLYSWKNTTIAVIADKPVAMITAYEGRNYREMRLRTMQIVKERLGVEFPGMEDEALPGEYYLDSLAVWPEYRQQGLGRMLLKHAINEGKALGLVVTLAVDPANPRAQQLYESLGFKPAGELFIFGHTYRKMKI